MAGDSATVEVDGHRIALTHLRKVLYPASGTTKSDIITYFAEVAHVMIPHLADRPVTRKRWPDGVTTAPVLPQGPAQGHAELGAAADDPAFRRAEELPDRRIAGDAGLAGRRSPRWNCMCRNGRSVPSPNPWPSRRTRSPRPAFDVVRPNRLVFDLDPGPGVELADCARVARCGPGPDGGHRAGPGHQRVQGHSPVLLAGRLADLGRGLRLRAGDRRGDRARPAGPGGVPDGEVVATRQGVHRLVAEQRIEDDDRPVLAAWTGASDGRGAAHLGGAGRPRAAAPGVRRGAASCWTARPIRCAGWRPGTTTARRPAAAPAGESAAADIQTGHLPVHALGRRRPPNRCPSRACCRTARTTPSSSRNITPGGLHYDFRLERDGVLVSWAVPKGVPESTGRNHLAVHTEDHPMDYADFAGEIPHGEYGGGTVSIWDRGTLRHREVARRRGDRRAARRRRPAAGTR